jgi:hypothetical protein
MNHDPARRSTADEAMTEQHIAARLTQRARHFDLTDTPVELVVRRGRQRQRRHHNIVGLVAVIGVCGSTIAAVTVLSRPGDHRVVGAPSPSDAAGAESADPTTMVGAETAAPATPLETATLTIVESNLVWNRVDPDSAEALGIGSTVAGDGPFVAWSTAPAQRDDYSPVLWRSDDGQTWEPVADAPFASYVALSELDGRFFAFGTTPAIASNSGLGYDLAVSLSDDAGRTWSSAALPIDVTELAAAQGVSSVGMYPLALATGTHGVLVAAQVTPFIDWERLMPAEANANGWTTTADGVDVYGPPPCAGPSATVVGTFPLATVPTTTLVDAVAGPLKPAAPSLVVDTTSVVVDAAAVGTSTTTIAIGTIGDEVNAIIPPAPGPECTEPTIVDSLTWAELGIDPDAGRASMGSNPRFYFSADGVSFAEVKRPSTPEGSFIGDLRIAAVDDHFVAWTGSYRPDGSSAISALFETTDGQAWIDATPPPLDYPETLAAIGSRLVATGYAFDTNSTRVALRNDDGSWVSVDLNDLILPSDGVKASFAAGGASVGPTGITAIGWLNVDPVAEIGGVELTIDGVTVRAEDSSRSFRFLDAATGSEIATIEDYNSPGALVEISNRDGSFLVRRTTDGPVVATFDQDDIDSMFQDAYRAAANPTAYVLHSTDGLNWSREKVDDIVGETISGAGSFRQTATQVIVAANLAGQTNDNGTPKQVLLIGTPRT